MSRMSRIDGVGALHYSPTLPPLLQGTCPPMPNMAGGSDVLDMKVEAVWEKEEGIDGL
jgi:hypothetical protein